MYYIAVPKDFLKLHKFVTLVADVMFVDDAPLLITVSRGIKFVTVENIPNRTDKQLSRSLKHVMRIYSRSIIIV